MSSVSAPRNTFLHGRWTVDDSSALYGIPDWGKGYVRTTPLGTLAVTPDKDPGRQIDLFELVQGLREREIHTPVVIRFTDMVRHRLTEMRQAFDAAIKEHEYQGSYCCVYPIKVNQQRQVCEEIRDIGATLNFGLEAGSKPELWAVLGMTTKPEHQAMPIVCNGFKDNEFIETVILATKLGRHIIPVVERFSDLELIVKHAKRYGVRPRIGVRIKPSSPGKGKWEDSSGIRSKFGLFVSELLQALDYLKQHDMADCLRMIHFHIGSQVCDIRQLKNAVNELAHIYTELKKLGAGLDTIDIGGGLGVDYDGSQSAWASSINYTVAEYASDVVYRIRQACDASGVSHPRILSESGRAMVAYSSVLVFDVVGKSRFASDPKLDEIKQLLAKEEEPPQPVTDLVDSFERLSDRNMVEVYHDAVQARDEALSLFNLGYMSLTMRASAERLFWAIGRQILSRSQRLGELSEDLQNLPELLSDIYYCNFSLFQSMPDSWAIDQLFPVCPIHRLHEEPTRRAVLADITCDSDGKIDHFVDKRDVKKILELHEIKDDEPYYLAVFLVGAYQEVLGDLHNLFGDTHVVHVSFDDTPGADNWDIDEVIEGDTVKEVLGYVQFDHEDLVRDMRRDVERAVKAGTMSVAESQNLLKFYDQGMEGYTYLEG